jgi:hypothetical protein
MIDYLQGTFIHITAPKISAFNLPAWLESKLPCGSDIFPERACPLPKGDIQSWEDARRRTSCR